MNTVYFNNMSEPIQQNQEATQQAQSSSQTPTNIVTPAGEQSASNASELPQNQTQIQQAENGHKSTIEGTDEIQQSSQKPDRNSYQYGYLPTEVDATTYDQPTHYQYQYPHLNEPIHYGMPVPQFNGTAYCPPMWNPMHFQPYSHHPQYHRGPPFPHNWAGFVPPVMQPHWQTYKQFQPFQQRGHHFGGKSRGGCRFSNNFKEKGHKKQKRDKQSSSQSSQRSQSKSKSHKKHWHKNRKSKQYEQKNKYYNKKIEQSDTQNSQSEAELKTLQNQIKNITLTDEKRQNYNEFENCLLEFFNKYDIKQKNRKRTIEYLLSRYSKLEDLDPLISLLFELERVSPHYFTQKQLNFSSIVKSIIKKGFRIQEINGLLDKKLFLKNKKTQHDSKFRQKFPNAQQIDFLEVADLMALDLDKTLFLVDGNNIMQKQKKFRLYYESNYPNERAEGQVRLTWLFAQSLTAEVFFDTKYGDDIYTWIKQSILSQQEEELVNRVPVFYADKHLNESNTADMKIVSRLAEIVEDDKYKGYEIVLVSADRQLAQLCNAIAPIKKTAGRFIFKCCKSVIKQGNYKNPNKKDLIKRIFTY